MSFAYILTLVPTGTTRGRLSADLSALLEKQSDYDLQREFFPWACGFAAERSARFAVPTTRADAVGRRRDRIAGQCAVKSAKQIGTQLELLDGMFGGPARPREAGIAGAMLFVPRALKDLAGGYRSKPTRL